MKIDSSSVPPVIPNQPVDGVDLTASQTNTNGQPAPTAGDPAGTATTEFGDRRMENDLHTLNMKTKIGSAGASTAPGAPVVLSSKTSGPPSGPESPKAPRDPHATITHFQKNVVPGIVNKSERAIEQAEMIINGDLTTGQYAASMGNPKQLLNQLKDLEQRTGDLLAAANDLRRDAMAVNASGRGIAVDVEESLRKLKTNLDQVSATRKALEAILGDGGPGGASGFGSAAGSAAKGLKPGQIKGAVEGANAAGEEAAEAISRGANKAMGEAAKEALGEAAVKGLVATGGRAFLSALGELGLPMLDAIMVGIDGLRAMEEGKERLKQRNTAEGFSAGLAAGLLNESPDWVREKLGFHSASPEITDRVLGAEGLAEKSFNDGLVAGYRFARSLTPDQKTQLREAAFKSLAAQGYQVNEKDFFGERNVRKTGAALLPILQAMVEKAREEEEARAAAARPQRDYIGHNI